MVGFPTSSQQHTSFRAKNLRKNLPTYREIHIWANCRDQKHDLGTPNGRVAGNLGWGHFIARFTWWQTSHHAPAAVLNFHYPCLCRATIPPCCRCWEVWKVAFEALGGEDDVLVLMVVGPQPDALDTLPVPSSLKNSWKFFLERQTKRWCFLGGWLFGWVILCWK